MAALIRRRQPRPRLGRVHTPQQIRALRASGVQLDLTGRDTATPMILGVRQPWQAQAWGYYHTVGELRYANKFQGHAARRTLYYPAVWVAGETKPVPVEDSDDTRWADVAREALDRLGNAGTRGDLARATMENLKVAGEAYLVGRTDPTVGGETWEIRSTSEILVKDGRPAIREYPGSRSLIPLGPDDFIARLWTPDPEYRLLADSPVRVAIDSCLEELVLLGKDIRASATSRLALNGILALPDTLSIIAADSPDSGGRAEDDPFLADLIDAASEAIRNPGSAAAALPLLLRGPAAEIAAIKQITLTRPESDNEKKRAEALDRLAATLDLPPEIMSGLGSMNHWSSWSITESMWRDHLEPSVQDIVEAWTVAYYRPYLAAAGVPAEVAARMTIWYDPTNVVVKPDRSQAAADAYERMEISGAALRDHLGFREEEAPSREELLVRAALRGVLGPEAALAILQGKTPPDPATSSMEPAGDGGDVVDAEPVEDGPPNNGVPPDPEPAPQALPDAAAMRQTIGRYTRTAIAPPMLGAATTVLDPDEAVAISQRLTTIDSQLREKVRGACEAAVKRALEKAGVRLRNKVSRDRVAAAAIADVPPWAVPYRLGPGLTAALGMEEEGLLATVLAELEALWHRYVEGGSTQALRQAARLVGMDVNEAFGVLDGRFRQDRAAGWVFLRDRLGDVARAALLADPADAVAAGRLVSPSVARAALAVAGGFNTPTSKGIDVDTLLPVDRTEHFGGIGTGTTIRTFLEDNGARVERYQWIHGFSEHPFEPHLKLDRMFFDSWDDDVLRAPEGADFMGSHMRPGDHKGCSCDMVLVWVPPPAQQQGEQQ